MTTALATTTNGATLSGAVMERVVIEGDLSVLSAAQRVEYYKAVCESVGLNPFTKPFDYIKLNGKMVLYAKREATEQLRKIHRVSLAIVNRETIEGVYVVTAKAIDKTGRADEATGAVTIKSLNGETLANAFMKAETKAKRRVTLSICGLGFLDESEAGSIPGALAVKVDIETGEIVEAQIVDDEETPTGNAIAEELKTEATGDEQARPWDAVTARRFLQREALQDKTRAAASDARKFFAALGCIKRVTDEDRRKFTSFCYEFESMKEAMDSGVLTVGMCKALYSLFEIKVDPNPDDPGKTMLVPGRYATVEFERIIAAYDAIPRDPGLRDGIDQKGNELPTEAPLFDNAGEATP